MSVETLKALVSKDLALYFKNRFFALITVLTLAAMLVAYFLVPEEVDETIELGFVGEVLPAEFDQLASEDGLRLVRYSDRAALEGAVQRGEIEAGFVLPEDLLITPVPSSRPIVELLYDAQLPQEMVDLLPLIIEEIFFGIAGQAVNIDVRGEVLGPDLIGQPIAPRDRMLPMLTIFVLMVETLGLASLITSEIEWGTVQALLVTPVRIWDLFASKLVTGFALAFSQGLIILLVTGGLRDQPALMLLIIALGALLFTSVAFLLSSISKDMLTVTGWGTLAILILALPSFNLVLPGLTSGWVRVIPSYYLIEPVHQVLNFGATAADVLANLTVLAALTVALLGLGVLTLRRRFS